MNICLKEKHGQEWFCSCYKCKGKAESDLSDLLWSLVSKWNEYAGGHLKRMDLYPEGDLKHDREKDFFSIYSLCATDLARTLEENGVEDRRS